MKGSSRGLRNPGVSQPWICSPAHAVASLKELVFTRTRVWSNGTQHPPSDGAAWPWALRSGRAAPKPAPVFLGFFEEQTGLLFPAALTWPRAHLPARGLRGNRSTCQPRMASTGLRDPCALSWPRLGVTLGPRSCYLSLRAHEYLIPFKKCLNRQTVLLEVLLCAAELGLEGRCVDRARVCFSCCVSGRPRGCRRQRRQSGWASGTALSLSAETRGKPVHQLLESSGVVTVPSAGGLGGAPREPVPTSVQ